MRSEDRNHQRATRTLAVTAALVAAAALAAGCSSGASKAATANSAKSTSSSAPAIDAGKLGLAVAGKLTIAAQADQNPFDYTVNGKVTGFSIDLDNEIAKRLHLTPDIKVLAFAAILPGIGSGQYDISGAGLAYAADRAKLVQFSNPIYYGFNALIALKTSNYNGFDAMAGKTVSVVTGTVQDKWLTTNLTKATIKRFPSQTAALAALKAGQVDGFMVGGADSKNYLKTDSTLGLVATVSQDVPTEIATPLNNKPLHDAVNAELDAMIKDGTWKKLYTQYFADQALPPALVQSYPGLGS